MNAEEQIKSAKAVLEQIISDVKDAGETGDLQLFYERMAANRDDAKRLIKKLAPPSRLEKALENARHYLCDSDLTVEQQVKLIADTEDEEKIIDDIDGVVVWAPLESMYSVEKFLDLINY